MNPIHTLAFYQNYARLLVKTCDKDEIGKILITIKKHQGEDQEKFMRGILNEQYKKLKGEVK